MYTDEDCEEGADELLHMQGADRPCNMPDQAVRSGRLSAVGANAEQYPVGSLY